MLFSKKWTVKDLPDQHGKIAVITGANSGIGLEAAKQLARKGAHVILACRSLERGEEALAEVRAQGDQIKAEVRELDLADLSSVRAFARDLLAEHDRIDLLINNAGVMAIPYAKTEEGFEMQFGTNHLGHFALTGLLLDALSKGGNGAPARVVNVTSSAHRLSKMRFDDLHWERGYDKWRAYGQSKLANLLFTYELDRRIKAAKLPVVTVACHPGYTQSNLAAAGPRMEGSKIKEVVASLVGKIGAQSTSMGTLPILYAACAEGVQSGDYIGPDGIFEARGYPTKVDSNKPSHDVQDAAKLWERSEQLTSVIYEPLIPA